MKNITGVTSNSRPDPVIKGLGFFICLFCAFSFNTAAFGDITSDLVGYWNFDSGNGTTVNDCSLPNCNGPNSGTLSCGPAVTGFTCTPATLVNLPILKTDGTVLVPAVPGTGAGNAALSSTWSYATGGTVESQYLNVANSPNLKLVAKVNTQSDDFTFAAWIYLNSFGGNGMGAIINSDPNTGGYVFSVNNNYDSYTKTNSPAALTVQLGGTPSVISNHNVITTKAWHHVAFTRQGSNATFYVDGIAQGTSTITSGDIVPTSPIQIGGGTTGGWFAFDGIIDEARIYNGRALTINEIDDICGMCAPASPPIMSAIQATNVNSSSATITWTTDEPSDSLVMYGQTTSYELTPNPPVIQDAITTQGGGVTMHAVVLSGLLSSTVYHFQVISKRAAGGPSTSGDYTFTTASPSDSTAVTQSMFYTNLGLYLGNPANDTYPHHYVIAQPFQGYYISAADFKGIDPGSLISDNTYYGDEGGAATTYPASESAVDLSATKGNSIPLDFLSLHQGVYFIRIIGRVNEPSIPRIVKPLILDFSINDGPNGETNVYKLKVLYSNYLEETGRIFFNQLQPFNTNTNTNVTLHGVLSVDPISQEDLLVHRIDFFDALTGMPIQKLKTSATTFTPEEQSYIQAHKPGNVSTLPVIKSIQPGTDPNFSADRQARDDVIWNALPPINSMHTGDGDYATFNAGPWPNNQTASAYTSQYGSWSLQTREDDDRNSPGYDGYNDAYDFDMPWLLVNSKTGLTYSLSDYIAHKPLPDPTPNDPNVCRDAGFGCYFSSTVGTTYNSPGAYQFIIGPRIFYRMEIQYSGALFGQGSDGGSGLPYRYYVNGDPTTARDASLGLVRFALQWPASQMDSQGLVYNSATPDLDFGGNFHWAASRPGKIYYNGWTGPLVDGYVQAYDYLYNYICGTPDSNGHCTNQELASAVHRYVPWVNTADDVIALLDTYLLQTSYNDGISNRIEIDNPVLLGLVMENGPVAQKLMDISKVQILIDPLSPDITSMKRHYRTSIGQDGSTLIGSLNYTMGESTPFLDSADPIARYKASTGQSVPYDLTDLSKFPKIKSYADTFSNILVAGGYMSPFGDSGDGVDVARHSLTTSAQPAYVPLVQFVSMWKYGGFNPKVAWILTNVAGRTTQTDDEWNAIVAAAATVNDPRLSSDSRVFNGLGLGILESGVLDSAGNPDLNYQDKSAVVIRTGTGQGHAHYDALDLAWYAMGLRMGTPYGTRNDSATTQSVPADNASFTQNTVEIDGLMHPLNVSNGWPGGSFEGAEAWVDSFAPGATVQGPRAQYISAAGQSNTHTNVTTFRRDDALIDIDSSHAYVFDVFRAGGGQLHTWCFHGADTDNEAGGMTVNTNMSSSLDAEATQYLRKFATGTTSQGTAPNNAPLQVIWQLGRSSSTFNPTNGNNTVLPNPVTTVAAEQSMLGSDYNANSPRKYTKVTLFDRPGDKVMAGNIYSTYNFYEPNIFVQSGLGDITTSSNPSGVAYDPTSNKQDVYPAIIEAYAGSSLITSSSSLTSTITPNDNTALQAVALSASLSNGNNDIMYSDGESNTTRTVNSSMTINARSAYFSTNNNVFRMMNIVGGTQLSNGVYSLKPSVGVVSSTIQSVDYINQKIYTTTPIPSNLINRDFRIYNANHHTAYTITAIANSGNGSVLSFAKPSDVGEISVDSISGNTLTSAQSWNLSYLPNRNQGFTATNESGTKVFKIGKASTSTGETGNIMMPNPSDPNGMPVLSDFTDADGDGVVQAIIYDFGFGDTIEADTSVTLKFNNANNTYSIMAPVDTTITIPGSGNIQVSPDKTTWTNLSTKLSNGEVTALVPANSAVQYLQVGATLTSVSTGDASGDGKVSMYDAALVLRFLSGSILSGTQQTSAEITGDNAPSIADALAIARKAIGL